MPEPQQQDDQSAEIFAVLRAKRDKLKKLPPEMQALGLGAVFDEFVKPRLRASGISDKDMNVARQNFAKHMLGEGGQLPEDFGKPPTPEAGIADKASAFGAGAYGKAAGIVKTLADWDLKAAKAIGGDREARRDSFMKRLRDYAAKRESEVYGQASEVSPKAAKAGALTAEGAMIAGPYEGAASLIPKVSKGAPLLAKIASRAGRGAAGFGASSAMTTSDPSEVGKAAATGAVAGPVVDPALEKLFGVLGKLFGSRAEQAVSQEKPSATSAAAPTKFKRWMEMTPEEQRAYAKTSPAAQPKAEKVSTKPTTATAPKPKADTKEAAQWRQRQYVKLSKAGVRPVGTIKDKVQQGMTAEQILGERSGASTPPPKAEAVPTPAAKVADTAIAQAENPQAAAAVKGVTKVAEGPTLEELRWRQAQYDKLNEMADLNVFRYTPKEFQVRLRELVGAGLSAEEIKTGIGRGLTHQQLLDEAVARRKITKVAEGVHGAGALGRGQVRAETEAEVRKKAIREAAPLVEKGIEHGTQEDAPGRIVPITRQGLSTIEAMDALKAIKVPDKDIGLIARAFEKYRKSGKVSDEDMRAGLEKTYQTIGQWMGIEGSEEMSLEELYARLSGRIH